MGDSESEKMILEQSSFAKMAEDLENQELEVFCYLLFKMNLIENMKCSF